jgi:hypothetical protein
MRHFPSHRQLSWAFGKPCLVLVLLAVSTLSQSQTQAPTTSVPTMVKFSGTVHDARSLMLGVTFALYKDQQGGAPLWLETRSVQLDDSGHYSVQLGSTEPNGLPKELFASGEARWLGVQPEGQAEQPRVLLLSVPYALKAADAETIGGLPPSAFMLATPSASTSSASSTSAPAGSAATTTSLPATTTLNFLPIFTDNGGTLGNSAAFQTGSGTTAKIGINTTTPVATLDVKGTGTIRGLFTLPASGAATATKGANSQPFNMVASAFNSTSGTAVNQTFSWQAEPAGNNTATSSATMNLLFGAAPTKPVETGFNIASNGLVTFATGQTFPGTGTISGVSAGSGLSGGGTIGNVTLGLSNACASGQVLQWNGTTWACTTVGGGGTITGVTAGTGLTGGGSSGTVAISIDNTNVPLLTSSNSFTGDQTIGGKLNISTTTTQFPLFVQSNSTLGTWLQVSNTSAGGHTWNMFSAGSGSPIGAGNLGIADSNSSASTLFVLGNFAVSNTQQSVVGDMGCGAVFGGVGFGVHPNVGCTGYSLLGGDGNTYFNRPTGGALLFRENNTTEMILTSGGALGIGTLNPLYTLHVNGGIRGETALSLGGNAPVAVDAPGIVGGRFTVLANGKVGIANPNPQATLDVAGSVNSSSLTTQSLSINGDTPLSNAPRMTFTVSLPGSMASNPSPVGYFVPDRAITIVRASVGATAGSGCSSAASVVLAWGTNFGTTYSIFVPNTNTFVDSGSISIVLAAGSPIIVYPVGASGCGITGSSPSNANVIVQYVMQ